MNIHSHPNYSLFKAIVIFSIAIIFLLYEFALQVSPSVMAFDLMKSLNIQSTGLGIMAGTYFYSYSFMQLPAGLFYDRMGARLLITLAIIICALGAFLFGIAPSIFWASLARFFMGLGSAFAFTGVLVISAFWFHPHRFSFLAGMTQFFAAVGALIGAYPMALLIKAYNWREVILALAAIGFILAILAFLIIRDHPKEKCSPSLVKTPKIKESIQEVFSRKQNWWSALYAFAGWGPVMIFAALWGSPFLVTRFGVSNELAATSMSAIWIGMAIFSPFFGWYSEYIKRRISILIATSILGLVSTLILIYSSSIPFWSTYILLFFLGAAGCSQLLTFALIKDNNRPTILATAMGFNNMAVVFGGAIFQPLVGYLLGLFWQGTMVDGVRQYTSFEFQMALSLMPLCFLICLIVSVFFMNETYCKPIYMSQHPAE